MKSLPYWFLGLATLFGLAGMIWGIAMGISEDFTLAPAHAHNNLLGFVAMAIYAFYYRLVPAASNTRLAAVHFWLAFLGALTFGPGLVLQLLNMTGVVIQIASLLVVLSMAVFAWIVWTHRSGLTNA